MILLPKIKIRKLQAGGSLPPPPQLSQDMFLNPLTGHTYVPLGEYPTAPVQAPGGRTSGNYTTPRSPRNVNVNKSSKTKDLLEEYAGKGLTSDNQYVMTMYSKKLQEIRDKALADPNYQSTTLYEQDMAELHKYVGWMANLETVRRDWKDMLQGKDIDSGSLAIHNEQVVVYDNEEGHYDVIPLYEAARKKEDDGQLRYRPLTIAEAQAKRSTDPSFNYFEGIGGKVQEIIVNSYSSKKLYDMIDKHLRNVGIHNSTESDIIVGNQKVNADKFVQYLDTDEPVRAIISTKTKSNEKGLANAVKSLYYRVMSNTGTREAYTNFAYSKLIRDGIDVSKMTNSEFQQALAQIAAQDLMDRAKDFIMSEYGEKITTKTLGSANGIQPQDKESVEIDAVKIAQAKPDKVTRVELGVDPIEGKIHTFDFFSSTVPNTTNFYMSGRIGSEKGAPPVTDYNFLNNFNIGNVAYGDLNLGTILPTGDPVVSIITSSEYGKSLAAAVPHIGKEARILFSVPCSIDKDNDVPKVEFDYLVQENILQNELHKQLKKKKQEWQKKGLTDEQIFKEYMQLKKDVSTLLAKSSPAFREYKEKIESGEIIPMRVLTGTMIIQVEGKNFLKFGWDKEWLGLAKKAGLIKEEQDQDELRHIWSEYKGKDFSAESLGGDMLISVPYFIVMKPLHQQDQFKGYDKKKVKIWRLRNMLKQQEHFLDRKPPESIIEHELKSFDTHEQSQ